MSKNIVEDTIKRMDRLVGLEKFENVIREIGEMAIHGKLKENAIYFCLLGNPGTGKIAFAHLLASMLEELGVFKTDHVVEISRADLEWISKAEMEQKISQVLEATKGGMLCIEDAPGAFSLAFDQLAGTLAQRDTSIVLSGDTQEMRGILLLPQLAEKISFNLEFPDYSPAELLAVAKELARDYQLTMTDEAAQKLLDILNKKEPWLGKLGNARYIKNIIDRAYRNAADRLMTGTDLGKLLPSDIEEL